MLDKHAGADCFKSNNYVKKFIQKNSLANLVKIVSLKGFIKTKPIHINLIIF